MTTKTSWINYCTICVFNPPKCWEGKEPWLTQLQNVIKSCSYFWWDTCLLSHLLSRVRLSATPWTAACQASLPLSISMYHLTISLLVEWKENNYLIKGNKEEETSHNLNELLMTRGRLAWQIQCQEDPVRERIPMHPKALFHTQVPIYNTLTADSWAEDPPERVSSVAATETKAGNFRSLEVRGTERKPPRQLAVTLAKLKAEGEGTERLSVLQKELAAEL